jgi:uncharacterized membrane protein YkvA (DUF1232 family)
MMDLPVRRRPRGGRHIVRRLVRQIPRLLRLIARLLRDSRVATVDKVIFGAVLAYIVAPIDLMPDFLVGLGFADDLYLLGLALNRLFASAGGRVLLENWDGDAADLELLIEGVDDIGTVIPKPVRGKLESALRRVRRRARRRLRRRVGEA